MNGELTKPRPIAIVKRINPISTTGVNKSQMPSMGKLEEKTRYKELVTWCKASVLRIGLLTWTPWIVVVGCCCCSRWQSCIDVVGVTTSSLASWHSDVESTFKSPFERTNGDAGWSDDPSFPLSFPESVEVNPFSGFPLDIGGVIFPVSMTSLVFPLLWKCFMTIVNY